MAMTLSEANKLSNDVLLAGLTETVIEESPILAALPFADVIGTALRYNRENTLATVENRAVGDTWTEDTPTSTEVTVSLKIKGGDADVDNFLKLSRRDTNDLEAVTLQAKAKALARSWSDDFYYGDDSADPLTFDGLHNLIPTGQQIHVGSSSTGAALSVAKLDELIDKVRGRKPDMLVMTRACRRRLSTYMRSSGSPVNFSISEFGHRAMSWDEVPIFTDDFISDAETIANDAFSAKTGGATTSVFALRFGEDALLGLKAGDFPIIEHFDKLESKDASRVRLKAYTALALIGALTIAKIDGITTAAVTA